MSTPPSSPPTPDPKSLWKTLGVVVLVFFLLTILLGGVLFTRYRTFISYVHHTVTEPDTPPPWIANGPLSPEACVDASMKWARECHGIKSLCDRYVLRVTQQCMKQGSHVEYCHRVEQQAASTSFGAQECETRGVRRHVDGESCAKSYRAIANFCAYARDKERIRQGKAPLGPRAWHEQQRKQRSSYE